MSTALLQKLSDNDVNATVSSSREAAAGPQMQEENYAVGLTVLLTLIILGVVVSVLLCMSIRREPGLWMTVFEGFTLKKASDPRQLVKFPRRVRFQVPDGHKNRSSSKTTTNTLLSSQNNDVESQEYECEDGTLTICQ